MKFTKLTKKLLLSALSLGLAVVTLTTTTYAWFTSSTDANAGAGEGTISGETSSKTLLISTDGNSWGNYANIVDSTVDLTPLYFDGTNYRILDTEEGADGTEGSIVNTGYYSFSIMFRTTKTEFDENIKIYLTNVTLENITKDATAETNILKENTSDTGIPNGATYLVDVVRSLALVHANVAYDLEPRATIGKAFSESGFDTVGIDDADALVYYNQVMGTEYDRDNAEGLTELDLSDMVIGEITGTTDGGYVDLTVDFVVYLNGWDQYCFDACKGQKFSVSLEFTTAGKNI